MAYYPISGEIFMICCSTEQAVYTKICNLWYYLAKNFFSKFVSESYVYFCASLCFLFLYEIGMTNLHDDDNERCMAPSALLLVFYYSLENICVLTWL